LRKAEILGLEWARVDLSTSRVTLYRTKSGKPRGVPLNRAVYDALVGLEPDVATRTGLVFKGRVAGTWAGIRTAFAGALAAAGIKGFRFHDLRHTAASTWSCAGAVSRTCRKSLGHSDLKMTQRYAHLSRAHMRAAVDALDGLTPPRREPAWAHEWAQSAKIEPTRGEASAQVVEVAVAGGNAPVAQLDRATVS
jgi:integrase